MTEKTTKPKERKKFEDVIDPENFYIITEKDDRFVIDSLEEANELLEKLNNAEYNDKLAKFISQYSHNIKDLTKK